VSCGSIRLGHVAVLKNDAMLLNHCTLISRIYIINCLPGCKSVIYSFFNFSISNELPASQAECTDRYNIGRSHESIVFAPEQRGKTLYGFARWVNRNGKLGPWSGLFSAIIP
jgi:hypothetical protein